MDGQPLRVAHGPVRLEAAEAVRHRDLVQLGLAAVHEERVWRGGGCQVIPFRFFSRPPPKTESAIPTWLPDVLEDLPVQRELLDGEAGGVERQPLVLPRLAEVAVQEETLENQKDICVDGGTSFFKYCTRYTMYIYPQLTCSVSSTGPRLLTTRLMVIWTGLPLPNPGRTCLL